MNKLSEQMLLFASISLSLLIFIFLLPFNPILAATSYISIALLKLSGFSAKLVYNAGSFIIQTSNAKITFNQSLFEIIILIALLISFNFSDIKETFKKIGIALFLSIVFYSFFQIIMVLKYHLTPTSQEVDILPFVFFINMGLSVFVLLLWFWLDYEKIDSI